MTATTASKPVTTHTWDLKTRLMFRCVYSLIRLLDLSWRYRVFGADHRAKAESMHPRGMFVFATWHGNSLAGTIAHAHQDCSPLCSHSKDGSMVAYICERIGLRPVRGSSSRGGNEARDEMIRHISEGSRPAITVDGPKGPPCVTKAGVVAVAKAGGCAILPLCAMGQRNWVLGSWDRLHVPKPFSRVAVIYGEPIPVPEDADGEAFSAIQQQVTDALNKLQSMAPACFAVWGQGRKIRDYRR